jgi:radical SAM-linked protein
MSAEHAGAEQLGAEQASEHANRAEHAGDGQVLEHAGDGQAPTSASSASEHANRAEHAGDGQAPRLRLRIRFSKRGKVRFTSHRDVARIWERALRRVSLPVAYSQGFSPRPRIAFGLALSTGAESEAEYLDVDIDPAATADGFDADAIAPQLSAALPDGFDVMATAAVESGAVSLQQVVTSCRWIIDLPNVHHEVAKPAVDRLLAADSVIVRRERKGKEVEDDLRPGVLALEAEAMPLDDAGGGTRLVAELGAQPRALRPTELLDALGIDGDGARIRRTHQWIQDGHARREPLPSTPDAVPAREDARHSRRETTDVRPRGERPPVRTTGDPTGERGTTAADDHRAAEQPADLGGAGAAPLVRR